MSLAAKGSRRGYVLSTPQSNLQGLSQSGVLQHANIDPPPGTAGCPFANDHNGRNRTNAEFLRSPSDLYIVHVLHDDFAGGTCLPLHCFDCLLADSTTRAEYLDFTFVCHI